jgi:hypothetical protein
VNASAMGPLQCRRGRQIIQCSGPCPRPPSAAREDASLSTYSVRLSCRTMCVTPCLTRYFTLVISKPQSHNARLALSASRPAHVVGQIGRHHREGYRATHQDRLPGRGQLFCAVLADAQRDAAVLPLTDLFWEDRITAQLLLLSSSFQAWRPRCARCTASASQARGMACRPSRSTV